MGINSFKSNKGVSMTDVIIAVIVLCMFVGIIGQTYNQIALNNGLIRYNAVAVYYMVKISEDIDKMAYEEVVGELNNNIKEKYEIPDLLNMTLEVKNYNETDLNKQDIIKIVKIKAEYEFLNEKRSYEIEKLKIKEL